MEERQMLSVKDLRFSYGRTEILRGVSMNAEENEIVSILGPNGTGKTTLLKCMCNIHRPNGGTISVGGEDVLGLAGKGLAKNIGYVPQSVPTSRMTVFDSVLIGRRPHFTLNPSTDDVRIASEVIDMMGLSHLSLKYTDMISGGEFQKVQISRAIAQEPKVLILDEPTNNLDITNQHRTMHMVEDAVRSRGMCTIMTMHDINLAIHYSDRFVFIKDGVVAGSGGREIITEDLIEDVYGIRAEIIYHHDVPLVVPSASLASRHSSRTAHDHDIHDHYREFIPFDAFRSK